MRKLTCLLLLLLVVQLVYAQTKTVYFIGNSVTDAINISGLKNLSASSGKTLNWGRHMIPGAPLDWIWDHPADGFSESPYGLYPNALANYTFDAVSFQPFDRRDNEDIAAIQNFINTAGSRKATCQYYIYQRWPRAPNNIDNASDPSLTAAVWNAAWTPTYTGPGNWDNTVETRNYFETLTKGIRTNVSGIIKPLMVPVGEVFYQLNLKMAAGQIPGYTKIWNVYSDGIHLNKAGNYIASCVYYATLFKADPRGLGVPSDYGTLSSSFVTAVQQTVYDVVSTYKDDASNTWSGFASNSVAVASVSVSPASATIAAGATTQLTATVSPSNATNKTIIWSSANTSVATVNASGVVTGVAGGNVVITATTADGSKTATSSITVSANTGNVAVTGVSITPTSGIVNPGSTIQLTATVSPANATNKGITWSSSNSSVAMVNSSGLVSGIASGNVTILATTQDGGKTASSSLVVNAKPVAVLTASTLSGNAPLTVNFSSNGSSDPNAGDIVLGFEWNFGDGNANSNANSPSKTFTQPGTYTVTLRVVDNHELYSNSVTKTITVGGTTTSTTAARIGVNLSNPGLDYASDVVFADAMKASRQWTKIASTAEDDAPKDSDYWPTTDARCLVWADAPLTHGTYTLYFTGQATVSTGDGTLSAITYNSALNQSTATLSIPSGNSALYLTFTNTKRTASSATNTGVTNVKLMRPTAPGSPQSYPENKLFCDDIVSQMAPFKCLRSLGWVATNWNQDSLWTDRTLPRHARQSPPKNGKDYGWEGRGASYEYLIMFANQTQKDLWITIPHKVTDDYVTKLALMCKYGSDGVNPYTSAQANPIFPPLNSNLKLYLEYSNETWNDQFSQTWYIYAKGKTNAAVKFDGNDDQYQWGMRYRALRSVEISMLFRNVFGGEMMTRIRPVFCSQRGYLARTIQSMLFVDAYYGKRDSRSPWNDPHPVNYYFYGAGSSFYWNTEGPVNANTIWTSGTFNATASYNDQWGNPAGFYDVSLAESAWAKQFGLTYINYEGDTHPHYDGDEVVIRALKTGTWDNRLNQNTLDHLNVLNRVDAELSCFLSLNGTGGNDWAIRNLLNPANSPQMDAINYSNANPVGVTAGKLAPFTVPGNAYTTDSNNWPNLNGTGATTMTANTDYSRSYLFRLPNAGTYSVSVQYKTTGTATLILENLGKVLATYNLANSNGSSVTTAPVSFTGVSNKLYSLRLVTTAGSVQVESITIGSPSSTTNSKPVAVLNASPTTGVAPLLTSFNANGSSDPDAGNTIAGYEWNFGDGTANQTTAAPTHSYTTAGVYTATLRVKDNNDLFSDAVTKTITVTAPSGSTTATTATLAQWDFTGKGGQNNLAATTKAGDVATATAKLGAGLTVIDYLGAGLTGTQQAAKDLAGALSGNDYFSFSVAPAAGKSLTINRVEIRPVSQNRARTFVVFSSVNGFASGQQVGTFTGQDGLRAGLSSVSIINHANLTAPVEFRVYIYGGTDIYESVGAGNRDGASGTYDLAVIGSTANVQTVITGQIIREYWTGIPGNQISHVPTTQPISGSAILTSLEGPTMWADNYGDRIRGYVIPSTTGPYTFYVAGDDNVDLYLSTNDSPANKTRIAYVEDWTDSRQWTRFPAQKSSVLNLVAGQKYYVEVLHKEGDGGDHVAVGWTGPGIATISVIGGANIAPYQTTGSARLRADEPNPGIRLYPNPVGQAFTVSGLATESSVEIISMDGRLLKRHEAVADQSRVSTGELGTGLYFVRIANSVQGVVTQKIIKQ